MGQKQIGIRVDVDTLRGTRLGVPALIELFDRHRIKASFFFSVGPDNMGRHLWRLLRPSFFIKMIRSKAASLYGWDILLKGTLGPGPLIAKRAARQIRSASAAGHEIGLHAWDHWRWQQRLAKMSTERLITDMKKGITLLTDICGQPVTCAAAPAWMANGKVLAARDHFQLTYSSDCRGSSIFLPVMAETTHRTPQIPTTLPTYDECIGRNGITQSNYNDHIISLLTEKGLNVLTIHAEAEGISCLEMFDGFLAKINAHDWRCLPLGRLLPKTETIPACPMCRATIPGRQGWLAMQQQEDHS